MQAGRKDSSYQLTAHSDISWKDDHCSRDNYNGGSGDNGDNGNNSDNDNNDHNDDGDDADKNDNKDDSMTEDNNLCGSDSDAASRVDYLVDVITLDPFPMKDGILILP